MSRQVVTSSKFSSIEVVDFAKFDNEIVYEDLTMVGDSLNILCSDDIILTSTGTVAPYGISALSVGPINVASSNSDVNVLAGFDDGDTATSGSVVLGYATGAAPVIIVEAEFQSTGSLSKLGFFATTPVIQPTIAATVAGAFVPVTSGIVDDTATFAGYTLGQIAAALIALGILE